MTDSYLLQVLFSHYVGVLPDKICLAIQLTRIFDNFYAEFLNTLTSNKLFARIYQELYYIFLK